jgi:hypothetical protein
MKRIVMALAVVAVCTAAAPAQRIPKVRIDDNGVHVGFKTGSEASGAKVGAWTPVYVDLTAGSERVSQSDGDIVVETTDSDELQNAFTVRLPPLEPHEQTTIVTYARPGGSGSDIIVSIRDPDKRLLAQQKAGKSAYSAYPAGAFLYLTVGSASSGLRRALRPPKAGQAADQDVDDDNDHRNAFAFVTTVSQLPQRWFGYGSVDVVILNTYAGEFVQELSNDKTNRKEALAEWVRRGGRLVVSVGRDQNTWDLLGKLHLIGVTPTGIVQRKGLPGIVSWANAAGNPLLGPVRKELPDRPRADLDLVKLEIEPRKGVEVLATEPPDERDNVERPSIVQAGSGLGRVILVGINLDAPPFTDWGGQGAFWRKLNDQLRPGYSTQGQAPPVPGQFQPQPVRGMPYGGTDRSDAASVLQERLESFEEVPVISFGWVALFILIYIVVVGPLDYFFLKKVVKRLELTWITFPAVVLVVSAVAYFSAYYLKGNDLRINKLDVVDVVAELDAEGSRSQAAQAYGTTWFTLFSPRIQNYTIGVEPAPDGWVPLGEESATNPHSVVVGWMGRPEDTFGAPSQAGSPSLFRRTYEYAPDAAGLQGVPIQVWSTKSFTASWQAKLAAKPPLVVAELQWDKEHRTGLSGTITSNLPVVLKDVALFYDNEYYKLGDLAPGATVSLKDMNIGVPGGNPVITRLDNWFSSVQQYSSNQDYYYYTGQRQKPAAKFTASGLYQVLLFGDKDANGVNHPRNTTLRLLDQSWRLQEGHSAEVILVGKADNPFKDAGTTPPAEQVTQDGVSPTRLWLGGLPGPGKTRPALAGKLAQETYVRVFLPVVTK